MILDFINQNLKKSELEIAYTNSVTLVFQDIWLVRYLCIKDISIAQQVNSTLRALWLDNKK